MKQLIFVYNADSGLFGLVNDFAHKILSPFTYRCNLCRLTYGNFSMKNEWKKFIGQLPYDVVFLHKDEFERKYTIMCDLPAVFINENNLQQIIPASEIKACNSLAELQTLVTEKIVSHEYFSHR